ncbi:MAG: zinc-dependent metalloprotease [Flavisolibacter sp.]
MKNYYQSVLAFCLLFIAVTVRAQVPVYNSYPSATATIFIDFDGQTVEGTSWNAFGPIFCDPANVTTDQMTEIFNRVAEDYRPFNINITTDSTKYFSAPLNQRVRVIVTTSSSWYGSAGGVSYLNSFTWGNNTPAFVFSALLGYNTKRIAEATAHEMGHTLGLKHQSTYDNNCLKTAEYNPGTGSGEIGWAPIMGVGYYRNFTLWNHGTNPQGCNVFQDDLGIITRVQNGFGYRTDDHQANSVDATQAIMTNNQFVVDGVIERATDQDVFKFVIPALGNLKLDATPYNTGTGNSGSNLDIQLEILDQNFNLMYTYNPDIALDIAIDSTFAPGTYYMKVQGKGNVFAPEYASLGSYSITSSFRPLAPLPLHKLELKGNQAGNRHLLNWVIEADETVTSQVLEVADQNTRQFHPVSSLTSADRNFQYNPTATGWLQYRLLVSFDDGRSYYSNTITLPNRAGNKPELTTNMVRSEMSVRSAAAFQYTILDYNGRTISRGKLEQGLTRINTTMLSTGMYLVRFDNAQEHYVEKFVKE